MTSIGSNRSVPDNGLDSCVKFSGTGSHPVRTRPTICVNVGA